MVPFALSSQTRKAIPAGRYEALSGIKVSRTKNEVVQSNSSEASIWQEVMKNLPADKANYFYFKNYTNQELNLSALMPTKNFKEVTRPEMGFDLLISENLKVDKDKLNNLSKKGMILFITKMPLKETINYLASYDLILFQSINRENFYLLKLK
jgi:hypothetical protein